MAVAQEAERKVAGLIPGPVSRCPRTRRLTPTPPDMLVVTLYVP